MMRYIENSDLRDWVKENLRKAIFQKAHALAVQTGCEILVKFKDHHDNSACNQYYATHFLKHTFQHEGLCAKPEDQCVSGETGMPLIPTAEMGVQSLPMDPGGGQSSATYDRGKFHSPSESPSRHSSKHKSPASSQKRNGPFETDISPSHATDNSSTSAKRKKTNHKNKSTPSSSDGDVYSTPVGDHKPSDNDTSSPGLTPSPVPVKQFQCQSCGKRLKSAKSLEKHTKTFHSGQEKGKAAASSSHNKGHSSKQSYKEEPLASTPISPERYPCQKCDENFDSPENHDIHVKNFHKKLSKSLTPHHQGSSSPKKNTPKRENLTPKRDDHSSKHERLTPKRDDHSSKQEHLTPKRDDHSSKHERLTPKRDDHSSKQERLTPKRDDHSSKQEWLTPKRDDHSSKQERLTPKRDDHSSKQEHLTPRKGDHSPWYQDDYGHRRESHTPKQDNLTPKHSHHLLTPTKQDHTPRRENHNPDFTPKLNSTPKHDHTPKRDMTPKSDIVTPRHMIEHSTSSLPSLGLSPHPPFEMESPPAHSSASSSPLSAPKTPGEAVPSQFLFEHETHTSLADLPGSPTASQSSGSEPSRPNTPGDDAPSMSYEFSDEIQASIMNIPSISSEFIQESPSSPVDHYISPRSSSAKGYRKSSPKKAMRVSDFKTAILSTPGPIVTTISLQNNGPSSVRQISRIQFESAIQGLQIADFGYVVPLTVRHNAVLVFVKKSPQEIQEVWEERAEDMGLFALQKYQELYNLPAPPDISEHVKSQLIEQGHVTADMMNGVYSNRGYDYTMSMEY